MVVLQLSEQPPLIQAIFAGDVQEVIELIKNNSDVNYQDADKRTPLHAAAFKGDVEIISTLLENGARVDAKDNKWLTPLHRACFVNTEDAAIALLLKYNADVTARDKLYQTPLHIAAANDSYHCIELLLDKIPNINVTDRTGKTALHHAAYHGHTYIVESLITRGAIVNACDKRDFRPLHYAVQMNHSDTVELLIQYGAEVNVCDSNEYAPFHLAATNGNVNICRQLINAGASVNACNYFGNTPLHLACLKGHLSVSQELINAGANLEQCNYKEQTPLHVAAASAHGVECMLNLLTHNVDINKQSFDGRTPLHMTAIFGRFTRSKSLIDKGAIIDCTDKNGCTPLHIAAHHGHDLLANTLMMHGANPSLKGFDGRTPLHRCCLSGHVECCRKFLQAGVDLNITDNTGKTPLHCAAYKGSIECLDLLISNCADFNAKDDIARLAIHYAASKGHYQCVFTLVGVGSKVDTADDNGLTPLHLAAGYDMNVKCVEYLLRHRADPKKVDKNGFTPLHYAVAGGNLCAIKLLISALKEQETDITKVSKQKTTPLHLAAKQCPEILKELLDADPSNINAQAEHGLTPLMLASREGQAKGVELLVEQGAVISRRDADGMTAVHYASQHGHSECLLKMLEKDDGKKCISIADRQQRTPLMLAVSSNQVECVRALLDSCSDNLDAVINMVDADQHSSLFRAVVNGHSRIVQLLLTKNARADIRDVYGKKVIHLAAACGHLACLQILIDYLEPEEIQDFDNQMCTALHWACYTNHPACCESLLKNDLFSSLTGNAFSPVHCASYAGSVKCLEILINHYGEKVVHLKDFRKRYPLHIAALQGHTHCAKYLLDQNAEVNALDEDKRTPFIAAAQLGQNEVLELLLNYQVDKGYQDVFGNTALHWACLMKHSQTAILLLQDLNDTVLIDLVNKEKKTPLHVAARNGLIDVTRELLKKGASVTAVDSEGYTPALCCAPNNNVAQCLALILLSLPLAPINTLENGFPQNDRDIKNASILNGNDISKINKFNLTNHEIKNSNSNYSSDNDYF